jgi:hypothetical protein
MPLVDVNGSTGAADPSQIAVTGLKVGVTIGVMVISKVVVAVAHWPTAGVNV